MAMGNRLLSSMIMAALLSSCSSGSSDAPKNIDVIGTKKSSRPSASCDYAFTQGGSSPMALPMADIKASRFLKKYDASLIQSIQSSSGAETVRFAALAGVTFYQVADLEIDEKDCLFTNALPEAPSPVLNYFRESEAEVKKKNEGKSTLLGFYLDKERVEQISGVTSIGPVITVKNDSERYTMVHEFFHHVFGLNKDISGTQLQINLGKSNQAVSDAADNYNTVETMDNLEKLTVAFDNQSKDLIKVLKEYSLEEMTIEYELNDLYQRNALKYVNYYSRLNGDFYSVSSAESAIERIQKNEKMINALEAEAKKLALSGGNSSTALSVIAGTRQLFVNLKNEIRDVARLAQARVDAYKNSHNNVASLNQDFLSQKSLKHKSSDCNHAHGVDKFLDGIQSRVGKIKFKK
mgnify:FL=1|jgi:hypothetical protein